MLRCLVYPSHNALGLMAPCAAGLLAGIAGMQAGEERLLQLDVPASPQQQAEGSGEQMACQVTMKELLWRDTPEVIQPDNCFAMQI